jgi:hypothetical protein
VLPMLLGGRVIVDAVGHDLPRGTVLRSIEGRPAAAWLDHLAKMASVDGGRDDVRRARRRRAHRRLSRAPWYRAS